MMFRLFFSQEPKTPSAPAPEAPERPVDDSGVAPREEAKLRRLLADLDASSESSESSSSDTDRSERYLHSVSGPSTPSAWSSASEPNLSALTPCFKAHPPDGPIQRAPRPLPYDLGPKPKGTGKGKAPPLPLSKGAGKAAAKSSPVPKLPIGRRLSLKPSSVEAEAFNLVTARGEEGRESFPARARSEEELQVDLAELHETFAQPQSRPAAKPKARAKCQEILPRGIAQNVAIALARLGQGATQDLAGALRALSGEGASLGVPPDEVARLLEVWPEEKVLAPLVAFASSGSDPTPLRDVEKQLLPLLAIPRVRQRLRLLVLAGTAEKRVGEGIAQLQLLRRACYEIQNSSLLRELLAIIVLLFNYVNFGAAPPSARQATSGALKGVDVPSLLRLRETKAFKGDFPGFHMLHFVVKQLLKQRDSWKKETLDQELPSLRRASRVHLERVQSELQELRGEYVFVQTELQDHREDYHADGSESDDEAEEPLEEPANWGFLEKLLARGLDFANLAEAWLRGDEVLGRPYHPSVGGFRAFEPLQGEEGSAPPSWLWLQRPSGRWQRCWSEVRGPILVLYKVELHQCVGATYVALPGALLGDSVNKDEVLAQREEDGEAGEDAAPASASTSFELITTGESSGRLLRLRASSKKQAASWKSVLEEVASRPGAGYLTVSGPTRTSETLFCAAADEELAAFTRPRDALEAVEGLSRWRLRDFHCHRSTALSFQLVGKHSEELWHFTCQDITDAQRWFDYFTEPENPEPDEVPRLSPSDSCMSLGIDSGSLKEAFDPEPGLLREATRPIAEEPSSDEETTATCSPRETRVETLAQLELRLARHVNRLEQAMRAAEADCRELLRFFGLEESRPGAASLMESLNDFCGQVRSAWDDLEKAQAKIRQTPRKTPRAGLGGRPSVGPCRESAQSAVARARTEPVSRAMKDDTLQQWHRIWSLRSEGSTG